MSTRAVVYFHHNAEKDSNLNYTMKLYHHYDWYPEYLGSRLNDIFSKFKKMYESSNSWDQRDLFALIAQEWWFEMTPRYHSDTDYVYHVYFDNKREKPWYTKKFNYEIYFQRDGDHEWIRDEDKKLLYKNNVLYPITNEDEEN